MPMTKEFEGFLLYMGKETCLVGRENEFEK